mmetsp:Transcript_27616/g.91730  ORF Transcript_27616/g.91730 Transcript_27616/m.91730 type:complete len:245 (-) Transcript_27616:448-1182(-)
MQGALAARALARNLDPQLTFVAAVRVQEGIPSPKEEVLAADARGVGGNEGLAAKALAQVHRLPHVQIRAGSVDKPVGLRGEHESQGVGLLVLMLVALPSELGGPRLLRARGDVHAEGPDALGEVAVKPVLHLPRALDGLVPTVDELLEADLDRNAHDFRGRLLVLLGLLQNFLHGLPCIEADLLLNLLAVGVRADGVSVPFEVVLPAGGLVREGLVCVLDLHENLCHLVLLFLCLPRGLVRVVR